MFQGRPFDSLCWGLDNTVGVTILIMLRDNDVVKVAWDLHTAFVAVGSVPYTERPLHAGLNIRPGINGVSRSRVPTLRRRSSW